MIFANPAKKQVIPGKQLFSHLGVFQEINITSFSELEQMEHKSASNRHLRL